MTKSKRIRPNLQNRKQADILINEQFRVTPFYKVFEESLQSYAKKVYAAEMRRERLSKKSV